MFGACTGQLIYSVLGIGQTKESAAFRELLISSKIPNGMHYAEGSVVLPMGKVSVRWEKEKELVVFEVILPENTSCLFEYKNRKRVLTGGKNTWKVIG